MCGLNGAAGTVDLKGENVFKALLMLHMYRGEDSTGAVSLGRMTGDQPKIAKCLGPPFSLMDTQKFRNHVMFGSNKVYMGHNRWATRGAKTLANAHPFVFDNIFGAHNGTVYDAYLGDLKGFGDFNTDSETILNGIDTVGIEETIKVLRGAWALTWYDKRNDTINFLRNGERPLFYAHDKDHKQLFWASDINLLAYCLERAGIERDKPKSYRCPENIWLSWKLPNHGHAFDNPKIKLLEGAPEKKSSTKAPWTDEVSGMTDYFPSSSRPGLFEYDLDEHDHMIGKYDGVDYGPLVRTGQTRTGSSANRKSHIHERAAVKVKGNRFPMIYTSANCRIHYDMDKEKFHRYFLAETGEWIHSYYDKSVMPDEIRGKSLDDLLVAKIHGALPQIGSAPPDSPDENFRWRGHNMVVRKIMISRHDPKPWVAYYYEDETKVWNRHQTRTAPPEMPYTLIDVDSNHCFHIQKQKKNRPRMTFYKGWLGTLLTREMFNKHCEDGCLNCSRIPRWLEGKSGGVRVQFINTAHNFLCEFCAEDSQVVEAAKSIAVEISTSNTTGTTASATVPTALSILH